MQFFSRRNDFEKVMQVSTSVRSRRRGKGKWGERKGLLQPPFLFICADAGGRKTPIGHFALGGKHSKFPREVIHA